MNHRPGLGGGEGAAADPMQRLEQRIWAVISRHAVTACARACDRPMGVACVGAGYLTARFTVAALAKRGEAMHGFPSTS